MGTAVSGNIRVLGGIEGDKRGLGTECPWKAKGDVSTAERRVPPAAVHRQGLFFPDLEGVRRPHHRPCSAFLHLSVLRAFMHQVGCAKVST